MVQFKRKGTVQVLTMFGCLQFFTEIWIWSSVYIEIYRFDFMNKERFLLWLVYFLVSVARGVREDLAPKDMFRVTLSAQSLFMDSRMGWIVFQAQCQLYLHRPYQCCQWTRYTRTHHQTSMSLSMSTTYMVCIYSNKHSSRLNYTGRSQRMSTTQYLLICIEQNLSYPYAYRSAIVLA